VGLRLGEILVNRGLLTQAQVDEVLAQQAKTGRPFGDLAERLFGISPADVEHAWAEQLTCITEHVDPSREVVERDVCTLISSRQAWQFGLLPMRRENGELVVATTQEHLPRASRFVAWSIAAPVLFVIAERRALEKALQKHQPFPGMTLDVPAVPA
jgi:type IV pilus assembly protein PilB